VLVHRLGDTFAHRGLFDTKTTYNTGVGHFFAGTAPDKILTRPQLYAQYVRALAASLNDAKEGNPKLSPDELSAIARPLLTEAFRAQNDVQENVREGVRVKVKSDLQKGNIRFAADFDLNELGQRGSIPVRDVNQAIRNRYAQMIERETGQKVELRPELWSAKPSDGEGDEIANLRGFYAAMNIPKTDLEIKQMAAELNQAANNAAKVIVESPRGKSNEKAEAK